jgi:hypothetical protein
MDFSLRVTWKSSVLDKVLYLNEGHWRLFPTFIRPSQRYGGGRERPRFSYLRLRWEFSIVSPFIQYLNFLLDHFLLEIGLSTRSSMSAVPFTESLFVLHGVKIVLSLSSVTALQTIFDKCIPKKDLAKRHSQISTKYLPHRI